MLFWAQFICLSGGRISWRGGCSMRFGQFNWRKDVVFYRNSSKLVEVLEILYKLEPKFRTCGMCEQMKDMRHRDGRLLFCFSKSTT
jgi:hypothetical protein